MTWSREHDRIIAEKCEGLRVVVDRDGYWVEGDRVEWQPLPKYREFLPHTVRAAEAWRKQDENARSWSINSPEYGDTVMRGTAHNGRNPNWRTKHCYDEQPAAALAHALYQAVTG
jgi:hypothetical protein